MIDIGRLTCSYHVIQRCFSVTRILVALCPITLPKLNDETDHISFHLKRRTELEDRPYLTFLGTRRSNLYHLQQPTLAIVTVQRLTTYTTDPTRAHVIRCLTTPFPNRRIYSTINARVRQLERLPCSTSFRYLKQQNWLGPVPCLLEHLTISFRCSCVS